MRKFAILCLLMLALPVAALAQTGRVTGVITDQSGAVLPGVTVSIKAEGTGAMNATVSDATGRYEFTNVAPGNYELSFELPGFSVQTTKLVVQTGQPASLDAKLQIGSQTEQVQVTGSLIPRPTLEAMSPVTTLDVEELTYRGMTRVEDLLQSLPQVFAAQNSTVSNGASGAATVDLRYLGPQRTLVLIDGRRMSTGDAVTNIPAPDLNFIPSALVKRVDVLTGGASSTYGADAVAGVVNFVLDRDFEGIRGGVEFGSFQHNNNNEVAQAINAAKGFIAPSGSIWNQGPTDFNIALGGKFADRKGHASLYLDYRTTPFITKDQRDYTNCSVATLNEDGPKCGGSSTSAAGTFKVYNGSNVNVFNYTVDGTSFVPSTAANVFNYAPYNFMQRPDKRWAGGAFLNYEWNKKIQAYGDVMYMDDYTDAQIAPSGDFYNTTQVNCDNPMLSEQQYQAMCVAAGYGPHDMARVLIGRRNVEGGGRVARIRHVDTRISFGFKGDLNNAWAYDIYGLQAQVNSPQEYANDFNINNIQDALLVDGTRGDPSTWACRSGNVGCVPWNIFRTGGVTPAALAYLQLPEILNSGTRTRVVSGKITGDLKDYGIVSPAATEAVKVALGGEWRQEYLFIHPDMAYQLGLGAGSGGATLPIDGQYEVKEFFAEGLIPLVQEAKWAKDLSLELGYRLSDYTTTGAYATWKVQGSWTPVSDVKMRGGFNRATRSPNVVELYTSQSTQLGGSQDNCAGTTPAASYAQCAKEGVSPTQYGNISVNPATQYNVLAGGNPNLDPEVADTYSAGLVLAPRFLPGFTAALDFYNISIDKTIGALGPSDIQNQCEATGSAFLCGLIHRDQFGSLWLTPAGYTVATNQNVGKLQAEGIDVNTTYTRSLGRAGALSANLIGGYLLHEKTNTGLYEYDCVGFFGNQCGNPTPNWRHMMRLSWETRFDTTLTFGWRMVGGVSNDDFSDNAALRDETLFTAERNNKIDKISAQHFVDLAATYRLTKHYNFVVGCNNILDREPPMAPGQQNDDYGTGFYGTYDSLGRYFHVSFQFEF
jgi:iron complex outermembrane receptor protein